MDSSRWITERVRDKFLSCPIQNGGGDSRGLNQVLQFARNAWEPVGGELRYKSGHSQQADPQAQVPFVVKFTEADRTDAEWFLSEHKGLPCGVCIRTRG